MFNSNDTANIVVSSREPGVHLRVYKNDRLVQECPTPAVIRTSSSDGYFSKAMYKFEFTKDGCETKYVSRSATIAGSYWANILTMYLMPIGLLLVDPLTGAMYKISSEPINVSMGGTADADDSAHQADYTVLQFERVGSDGVAYDFSLQFRDDYNLRQVGKVQADIRTLVREAMCADVENAVKGSEGFVDFPQFKITGNVVSGRACAVRISIVSLEYDDKSHRGVIRVKCPEGQYKNARKWARENIETIVRDKNIALVTGEIPPSAHFYIGKERVAADNVLEIEFETE